MASTFTTSFGIEKIGTGEQAGSWGTTTNHNADILDRIASYKAVGLSGTTHTLTVREASPGAGTENLQDGMYRVIKFTGALGANNTVTIAPNTSAAWFIIENATTDSGSSGPYSVILTQGSGANVTIQNGKNAIVYCDGAGSGAVIYNALNDLQMATLEVTGAGAVDGALTVGGTTTVVALTASGLVTAGAKIDMNGTELILDADADTSITADTDDTIDIRIAGADDFQFTANTFTAQSGSTIAAQALTATTVTASDIVTANAKLDLNGTELILDVDADTSITADTDDTIDIRIAGADDFQFTANDFTALSGSVISTNTIAETTGGSGVTVDGLLIKDGGLSDLVLPAVSGIVESNANFIDMCLVGPSVDGMAWKGAFSNGAVWTSLMLATVETSGSDAQVNIWDLTAGTLAGATPLATLTLTGATPTSIAASMGYIIVGTSDQGMHIVDPHGGAWAERTEGWPRSSTASTVPAVDNNNIGFVTAVTSDGAPYDPLTGGKIPGFVIGYLSSTESWSLVKWDGNIWDASGYTSAALGVAGGHNVFYMSRVASATYSRTRLDTITADSWAPTGAVGGSGTTPKITNSGTQYGLSYDDNSNQLLWFGSDGFNVIVPNGATNPNDLIESLHATITRTYNTGFQIGDTKLAALANSDTADRSQLSNTLSEEGTVAEVAVATGAELKGYQFATANYLKTPVADADFEMGTGSFSASAWVYSESDPGTAMVLYYRNSVTGATPQWGFYHSSGTLKATISEGANSATVTAGTSVIDSKPHLLHMNFDGVSKTLSFYIDGVLEGTATDASLGTVSGGANFAVGIGNAPEGGAYSWDGTNSWLSLVRIAKSLSTASQVKQMYEAEKGMFVASAKCLLQSGSTDAVLDAIVDPLSGKYIVTQTDSQEIFDGLAIETERTIASGGSTFEHGLLWGDAVAEINDANLFASTPATDQRQVNEMVRSLSADLPAGVDLSKAKAWCVQSDNGGSPIIYASYNIESVALTATGTYKVTFATPFKLYTPGSGGAAQVGYAGFVTANYYNFGAVVVSGTLSTNEYAQVVTNYHDGVRYNSKWMAVFFGELENE